MVGAVIFDMDGVLADTESSWVFVHRRFRVNNDLSLRAYLEGEIDDLEFIRRDVQLWRDRDPEVSSAKVARILADVPIMPGAHQTVRELRENGVKTALVSAGIDLLARRISDDLGLDFWVANGLAENDLGLLTGAGILRVKLMDKGDAVKDAARALGVELSDTAAVGNSRYDISMFKQSGKGIAFCPLDEEVRMRADAVVDAKDLTNLLGLL